jgi:hypothetical protein
MHSTLASMPLGVGGVLQTVHPSYNPTHYYKNYSYYYGSSYRNYSHTSTAQRHLQKLMYDLDSIRPNTSISPSHVNTLYHDMMTLASSPKPSSSVVQNLAVNLAGGMVRRGSQQINTRQLATDLRTVLNGGHVQQNDIYNAMMQSQSILTSGGFQPNDAQTVLGHMQNVAVNSTFVRLQGYQFR